MHQTNTKALCVLLTCAVLTSGCAKTAKLHIVTEPPYSSILIRSDGGVVHAQGTTPPEGASFPLPVNNWSANTYTIEARGSKGQRVVRIVTTSIDKDYAGTVVAAGFGTIGLGFAIILLLLPFSGFPYNFSRLTPVTINLDQERLDPPLPAPQRQSTPVAPVDNCNNCNTSNKITANYCKSCGNNLTAATHDGKNK